MNDSRASLIAFAIVATLLTIAAMWTIYIVTGAL